MTNDSVGWLIRARSGVQSDVQPIASSVIWRGLELFHPGPMPWVVLNIGLVVFSSYFIFVRSITSKWLAAAALLGLFAYPPVLTILGVVWRDITGLGITLATFAITIGWLNHEPRNRPNLQVLVIVLLTVLGAAFRYNHVAGVLPCLLIGFWWSLKNLENRVIRFSLTLLLALSVATVSTLGSIWITKSFSEHRSFSSQAQKNYVLARMSLEAAENLFPSSIYPLLTLEMIEERLGSDEKAYRRIFWKAFSRNDDAAIPRLVTEDEYSKLNEAYFGAVTERWDLYLKIRVDECLRWLDFGNNYRGATLRMGFPDDLMAKEKVEVNFETAKPEWSWKLLREVDKFNNSVLGNNPLYILVLGIFAGITSLIFLPRNIGLAVCLVVAGGVLHFGGVVSVALSYEFRYGHQSIVLAAIGTLIFAFGLIESSVKKWS